MECENWIMSNPGTKAVNPGLQDIILLQELTFCGEISAWTWLSLFRLCATGTVSI